MSEVILTRGELDDYVRPRIEMVLITRHTNSSRLMHLKSEDECHEPICNTLADGWLDRSIAVYPPGYFEFCTQCVEAQFDVEVISDE